MEEKNNIEEFLVQLKAINTGRHAQEIKNTGDEQVLLLMYSRLSSEKVV